MAYEPTNWQAGDVVTSAKLNKLEQGVANGGGILVVHVDENDRLDKTWQEIYDADACIICSSGNLSKSFDFVIAISVVTQLSDLSQKFTITTQTELIYNASSRDDYPVGDGIK